MSRSQNITCFDFSLSADTATRLVTLNVTAQESSLSTDTATRQGALARTVADTSTSTDTATRIVLRPPPDDLPVELLLDPATVSQTLQGHVTSSVMEPGTGVLVLKPGDTLILAPSDQSTLQPLTTVLGLDGDE